jgi:hypothetical protein
MDIMIGDEMKERMWVPYVLRLVPEASFACLKPVPESPMSGMIAVATLKQIGKNSRLELANGRIASLHEGDLLAVVFGNRYATQQFEGYAEANGQRCDLLSMGGVCGLVKSRHSNIAEPSKLELLGIVADANHQPLRLRNFTRASTINGIKRRPRTLVVCGTAMDSGKSYTAASLIKGLQQSYARIAAIKLTGTAAGRDTWSMRDAGAAIALDFIDGGFPSTYLCDPEELLELRNRLLAQVSAQGADWVVMEIADGLLQRETAALLQEPRFAETVDAWLFAASDSMGAVAGIKMLNAWGITPIAVSGVLSMSPLGMRETYAATGITCMTAQELRRGELNAQLEVLTATRRFGDDRMKRAVLLGGGA